MIRVVLPYHLRNLARVQSEIQVDVNGNATLGGVLDAIETKYPMLKGTIRQHDTKARRPFVRFFAAGEDISFVAVDTRLPEKVVAGEEPFMVVGAVAGG